MDSNDVLLTARQIRTRYGDVSDMCLWRWLRDQKLSFPQPVLINGRRYWRLSNLHGWEISRPSKLEGRR
jgi:predicted DNA-binding transcriptional regulator AlpA